MISLVFLGTNLSEKGARVSVPVTKDPNRLVASHKVSCFGHLLGAGRATFVTIIRFHEKQAIVVAASPLLQWYRN